MRRALLALAVLALAFPPTAGASSQTTELTKTVCLGIDAGPVPVGCAIGTVRQTLDCNKPDATHVQCWGNLTWTGVGGNPNALGLGPTGTMVRSGGANMQWGSFTYGLGLLITHCGFGGTSPTCTDVLSYSMWSGPIPIAPGQCVTVTLAGWILVQTYGQPATVWAKLSPDGSISTAYASPTLSDSACA